MRFFSSIFINTCLRKSILAITFFCFGCAAQAQTVAQIKTALDTTHNLARYVKFTLNKKYKIDTIRILSTNSFMGTPDSLAYYGVEGKTYGPFKAKDGGKYLIKILGKASNTFYHVSHILLDTSIFRPRFADSLADVIINKIQSGANTFASMAILYSGDNTSASKGGDLGWFCRGAMMDQLDAAIERNKKGAIFKVWTKYGLHIVTITDNPKRDTGYALMLKVFL